MDHPMRQYHRSFLTAVRTQQIIAVGEILTTEYQIKEPMYIDRLLWSRLTPFTPFGQPLTQPELNTLQRHIQHILGFLQHSQQQTPPQTQEWLVPLNLAHRAGENYVFEPTSVIVRRHTYEEDITVLLVYIPNH